MNISKKERHSFIKSHEEKKSLWILFCVILVVESALLSDWLATKAELVKKYYCFRSVRQSRSTFLQVDVVSANSLE